MSVSSEEADRIIAELSASYPNDKEFEKFLWNGGGLHDLESGIAPLIYALWKRQVVKTTWSCHGHTARHHEMSTAITPGTFVFSRGFLSFEDITPEMSEKFFALLEMVLKPYPFATVLRRTKEQLDLYRSNGWPAAHNVEVTMDDLVSKTIDANTARQMLEVKEVPEALARERLALFFQIWKDLAVGIMTLGEK